MKGFVLLAVLAAGAIVASSSFHLPVDHGVQRLVYRPVAVQDPQFLGRAWREFEQELAIVAAETGRPPTADALDNAAEKLSVRLKRRGQLSDGIRFQLQRLTREYRAGVERAQAGYEGVPKGGDSFIKVTVRDAEDGSPVNVDDDGDSTLVYRTTVWDSGGGLVMAAGFGEGNDAANVSTVGPLQPGDYYIHVAWVDWTGQEFPDKRYISQMHKDVPCPLVAREFFLGDLTCSPFQGRTVSVGEGETVNVNVNLEHGVRFTLNTVDSRTGVGASSNVVVYNPTTLEIVFTTQTSFNFDEVPGELVVNIPEGTYDVYARRFGSGPAERMGVVVAGDTEETIFIDNPIPPFLEGSHSIDYDRFAVFAGGADFMTVELAAAVNYAGKGGSLELVNEFGGFSVDTKPLARIEVFDDGSHGDRQAGDGVYTRAGMGLVGRPTNREQRIGSDLILFARTGPDSFREVPSTQVISVNENYATDYAPQSLRAQCGPYVANIVPATTDPVSWAEVLALFYNNFPDSFDSVALNYPVASSPVKGAVAGLSHVTRNDITGIGLDVFDMNAGLNAAPGLEQVMYLNVSVDAPVVHEAVHRWANHMDLFDATEWGSHWGYSSVYGILGGFEEENFVDLGGGSYDTGFTAPLGFKSDTKDLAALELYLMGLIPIEDVPDTLVARDVSEVAGGIMASSIDVVTGDDIISQYGPRGMAKGMSRNYGFVGVKDRFMSQAELSYVSALAETFGGEVEDWRYSLEDHTDGGLSANTRYGPNRCKNFSDIDNRFNGSWFDPDHDGEGWTVQVIAPGLAVVYWFTYGPPGTGVQAWLSGVGRIVGNTLTVKDAIITSGGVFGAEFNPDSVVRAIWGDFSMHLTTCGKARVAYEAPALWGRGVFSAQQVASLDGGSCADDPLVTNSAKGVADAARLMTGTWYDPDHDGEGWVIEVISDELALVYWFTYDDQGNQSWTVNVGTIDGNTLTLKETFITSGTEFGPGFDPNDVVRTNWGSVVFVFDECGSTTVTYESLLAEYGSGELNAVRLAFPQGYECI